MTRRPSATTASRALPATITELDKTKPIYDNAQSYIDLNIRDRMRLWANKVGATI